MEGTDWFDGGDAPPNPAPLAAAGVRGERGAGGKRTEGGKEIEELAHGAREQKANSWLPTVRVVCGLPRLTNPRQKGDQLFNFRLRPS